MRYRRSYNCIISFVVTLLIMMIAFGANDLAPFGSRTLGSVSEYNAIDYIRAVLDGRQNAFYTFSGTSGAGIFYRLSEVLFSPASHIIALSPSASFEKVYDIVYIFKIALAAASCAAFLNYRFFTGKNIVNKGMEFKHAACISVSILYAVSGITLTAGISVADGAIFLPLILLGVYKTASDKGAQMFMISMLINLVFNWYTGFFNAIIALLWMIFEMLLQIVGSEGFVKQTDLHMIASRLIRFVISIVLAGGATCAIWFSSLKLVPDTQCESLFTAQINFPGICIIILGILGLLTLLFINNCRYTIKITIVVFTSLFCTIMMSPTIVNLIAGGGRIDATIRPLKYVVALIAVFIFAHTFMTYNNFSKRKHIDKITAGITTALMIAGIITCVFVPLGNRFKDQIEPSETYDQRSQVLRTLIGAVRDLDKGMYRIAFVSDDLTKVTLLSSEDDYIYFDDESFKIDTAGDICGITYPYSVKYFISAADLCSISGSDAPLGEAGGYKVYQNSYYMPMAYVYDGSYFDVEFRNSDSDTRLKMAASARENVASAVTVKANDMKFMCQGEEGDNLFISIPADSHMSITVNGIRNIPRLYEGRFYTIALKEGTNTVTMNYLPDFFEDTVVISLIGIILLMLFIFVENFYDTYYPER